MFCDNPKPNPKNPLCSKPIGDEIWGCEICNSSKVVK